VSDIPADHPRAQSLRIRETIKQYCRLGLVAEAGPIAHGRGEAFDYLLGEQTPPPVLADIEAAAALLLEAKHPVISVNGNIAVLAPESLIALARKIPAKLEVNVFYGRTTEREQKIADYLISHGAEEVLGVNPTAKVPSLYSPRGRVDANGIAAADVVLVPLEDGDRMEALIRWGKKAISIDLNPLSRTAMNATLNLCDNAIRVLPLLAQAVDALRADPGRRRDAIANINNHRSIARVLTYLNQRLKTLGTQIYEFCLVEATQAHVDFILDLAQTAFEDGWWPIEGNMLGREYLHSTLNSNDAFIYVISSAQVPCGFVVGEGNEAGQCCLKYLALEKQYRGLGAGKLLVNQLEEAAVHKGFGKIIVQIPNPCIDVQVLFLNQGYVIEGFCKKDACPCPILVMTKEV